MDDGVKTIMLDKPRKIKISLNAMLKFHEETGIDLQKPKQSDDMDFKNMRYLLYLALQNEPPTTLIGKIKRALGVDKDLTLEQVGDYIHTGNINEIVASVGASQQQASKKNKVG